MHSFISQYHYWQLQFKNWNRIPDSTPARMDRPPEINQATKAFKEASPAADVARSLMVFRSRRKQAWLVVSHDDDYFYCAYLRFDVST
jgi:hypothetical protein